jgi:hypothetical protein
VEPDLARLQALAEPMGFVATQISGRQQHGLADGALELGESHVLISADLMNPSRSP